MRTKFVVIPAALLAASLAASSAVLAQGDRCSATYGNCISSCFQSKIKTGQDKCVDNCQTSSNQCYEQAFGARPKTIVTGERPLTANDALATSPKPAPQTQAAPQTPVAPQPAPAPAQAPARKSLAH